MSTRAAAPLRVAFHAINGVGLGHLVRVLCLATELRQLAPAVRLLILTNAGDPSLLLRAGIDHVRLPPRLGEPHADPDRVTTALPEPLEEAALVAALRAFAPDVVVFDTHAPMRVVRALPALGARAVLVLRELRAEALRSFVSSGAARAFDRIIVPHDPGEVDLAPLAGLPVSRVGPIVRTSARPARRGVRSTTPRVVAIAGGGGQPVDGARYARAVVDAHHLARLAIPTLETTLVLGPYGTAPDGAGSVRGLRIVQTSPDLPALLAPATLVVSQAGYNAVAELRALEKPAILVPGHRKAEDQRARARRLARAGAAVIARPEARAIADRITSLLSRPAALAAMRAAHRTVPLVPQNRAAAAAILRVVERPRDVRKVVLVAHDFAPKLGGMETVARSLAARLLASGIDVRVYTTTRLGAATAAGLGEGVVLPLYAPLSPPLRIDLARDLESTIDAALVDAPDVIHLCHAGLGPWVPALRAALPCVVTANVHGNDLLVPWVHHGEADAAYAARKIAGLAAADAVFCVSRFSRRLAELAGVAPAALRTVENGVDPARFAPGPRDPALMARLGIGTDDEVILTVSRLAPRKGHRTVLRAVAILARRRPHLKFVFTGASDALRNELLALARELGIEDRVVPTGFVADADLPALHRLASVFALLADGADDDVEGFGVALLEAAATGVPAVAARTGGVPEAVADGETGLLVRPGDPGAAAAAIERILDDRVLAETLGRAGRERVVASFSDARAAERMLAAWRAIAARAAPGRVDRTGVEIVRAAQQRGAARRSDRAARRDAFRAAIARGGVVRLRATGDGARLLPEALEDCALLGHAPRVEVKLRRFLERDFLEHALPHVAEIELAHGVPHASPDAPLAALQALPASVLERVRTVRIFLVPEARASQPLAVSAIPETHALRRFFRERGAVVVPPPELMRYLSDVPAGGPETGMIEPTNLCNLACPTCPTGTGKIKPLPQMTLERFDHVLGALGPRIRNLALWNYGEPLLNRALPEMIAHAKTAGVAVVKVSSNVHFLDGARGVDLLTSGLDVLILSVDGASQATYATFRKDGDFARVARSVAWLCAEKRRRALAKPRIELQFIAMRHNEHELPAMRRLAREWGVDALRIKTVGADDAASRALVPASRLLSRYEADRETPNARHAFCTMAWDHTVVNVDGSVTPCCYLRPDMGDAFVMGNVFETSFEAIWRGERYRAFRAAMLGGRDAMPVCDRCRGGTHDLLAAVEEVPS